MIKPTSKNTGIATKKPVIISAHEAFSLPNLLSKVCARASAPPECSRICPNIAPSPTTVATKPSVPPIPFWMLSITPVAGIPEPSPTKMLDISRAMNAFIFNLITRNKRRAIPPSAASNSCDSIKLGFIVFLIPVGVKIFPARLINPFVGMRAEVIALRLD